MLNIDVTASKKEFIERLKNGYFELNRSSNTEANYSKTKESRDTKAVCNFLSTDLFKEIAEMK